MANVSSTSGCLRFSSRFSRSLTTLILDVPTEHDRDQRECMDLLCSGIHTSFPVLSNLTIYTPHICPGFFEAKRPPNAQPYNWTFTSCPMASKTKGLSIDSTGKSTTGLERLLNTAFDCFHESPVEDKLEICFHSLYKCRLGPRTSHRPIPKHEYLAKYYPLRDNARIMYSRPTQRSISSRWGETENEWAETGAETQDTNWM